MWSSVWARAGPSRAVGRYLKGKNPEIRIVGVDIEGSILKEIWENDGVIPEGVEATTYKLEGIGEDFLPSTTDLSVVDEIVRSQRPRGLFMGATVGAPGGYFCRRLVGCGAGRRDQVLSQAGAGTAGRGGLPRCGRALSLQVLRQQMDARERFPGTGIRRGDAGRPAHLQDR